MPKMDADIVRKTVEANHDRKIESLRAKIEDLRNPANKEDGTVTISQAELSHIGFFLS